MKYVSYAQPQNGHQPPQNHPGRMFNPPYSNESQYNIPFSSAQLNEFFSNFEFLVPLGSSVAETAEYKIYF